jgi:hypothetical protein
MAMVVDDRALIFTDSNGEKVAIRQRITPKVGDRVVVHELEDGTFVTHGKDRFRVGDRVLVFDNLDNPVMLRIGAEQPSQQLYDWIDGTWQGWYQTVNDDANVGYSSNFDKNCLVISDYADSYNQYVEVESDWCYGTFKMHYKLNEGYESDPPLGLTAYLHQSETRWYFIVNGDDSYSVRLNTVNGGEWLGLYKNDTLLNKVDFARSLSIHTLKVVRDWNGLMKVYIDDIEYLSAIDNTITSSEKQGIYFRNYSFTRGIIIDYVSFDELV